MLERQSDEHEDCATASNHSTKCVKVTHSKDLSLQSLIRSCKAETPSLTIWEVVCSSCFLEMLKHWVGINLTCLSARIQSNRLRQTENRVPEQAQKQLSSGMLPEGPVPVQRAIVGCQSTDAVQQDKDWILATCALPPSATPCQYYFHLRQRLWWG